MLFIDLGFRKFLEFLFLINNFSVFLSNLNDEKVSFEKFIDLTIAHNN